jgi:hypothetical protein
MTGHGSFLVARRDRRSLLPQHLGALEEYLKDMARKYRHEGDGYLEMTSKQGFKKFWKTWTKKYRQDNPGTLDFASPYKA